VAQSPSRSFAAGTCTAALSVQNSTGCASIQINLGTSGATPPSQVLNLANWKLTLPVGRSGAATEISQPAPKSFSDQYFQADPAGDGVVFTAPCGGVTTSRSSYPRSELREMACAGSTNASWSTTSGSSTMEITEAITHIPVAKPQVIAGQVHDGVSKVIDCRLNGRRLYIENASGRTVAVLISNYRLGTKFAIKWVVQNGGIAIYYNGQYIMTYPMSDSGCYFKAGCYPQSKPSRGDSPAAYGQVIIYSLSVTHQ
jgi:poly(beta-D-mannuronate) lyase